MTLTRSRALDHRRRASIRQHREASLERAAATPSAAPTPEESSIARDRQRAVQHALALLSPEQRQAIEVAYYEGLSHSEIATRLGQPLGTVKTRIRTGMMALRDLLYPLIAPEVAQRGEEPAACARVVLPFPAPARAGRRPAPGYARRNREGPPCHGGTHTAKAVCAMYGRVWRRERSLPG